MLVIHSRTVQSLEMLLRRTPRHAARVRLLHYSLPVQRTRVGYETLRHVARQSPTCVHLPDRGVLSVVGPGVGAFLDGLLSSKMPPDDDRTHLYSVFLNAQGRILYDIFLYAHADAPGYFVEYDSRPSEAQPLLQMLKRHLLRSKIRIRDVSQDYDVWAMWDPVMPTDEARQWACHPTGVIEPVVKDEREEATRWGRQDGVLVDWRAAGMGWRLLARKGERPELASLSFEEGSAEDYRVHRYVHGVPEGIDDMPPTHAFPVNSSLDIMGALAFKKGCHVGQEHLSRARHVNALRRRLFPVVLHRANTPVDDAWKVPAPTFPPHTEVTTRWLHDAAHPTSARVKNTLVSCARGVGLAMLRSEDVDAWEDGRCLFEVEGGAAVGEERWCVSPSKPAWWPGVGTQRDGEVAG